MSTSSNTSIISKFITKEVENIYRKYSEIPQEEISMVASFIEKIEENKIEFDPYLNYNTTKSMAEILRNEDNIDMISLYLFLRANVNDEIELEEVKDAYNRLESDGCVEMHCYYFYYKHREEAMRELAKDELDNKLEDPYEVTALFNTEELGNMWVFATTVVSEIATVLDDNYGTNRDVEHDLGGYILIAKDKKDVEEIRQKIDLEHNLPEYVDLITCLNSESYTNSLMLLSSDYSISLLIPLNLSPKELLACMEQ